MNVNGLMLKFKIKNNLMPRYLTERLVLVGNEVQFELRHRVDVRIEMVKDEKTRRMLMNMGLQQFNRLPTSLKMETNLKNFKRNLIEHIKLHFV